MEEKLGGGPSPLLFFGYVPKGDFSQIWTREKEHKGEEEEGLKNGGRDEDGWERPPGIKREVREIQELYVYQTIFRL